jgi:hypothetical protein
VLEGGREGWLMVQRQILGRVWLAAGLAGLDTMLAISVKDVGAEGDRSASQSAAPAPQAPAPAGRGASPFVPPEPLDYATGTPKRSGRTWRRPGDGKCPSPLGPEIHSVRAGLDIDRDVRARQSECSRDLVEAIPALKS